MRVAVALLFASQAFAAWTGVQTASTVNLTNSAAATLTLTFGSALTVGNQAVITFSIGGSATFTSLTSGTNTITNNPGCVTNVRTICIFLVDITDPQTTFVLTLGGSAKYATMGGREYSGGTITERGHDSATGSNANPITCGTVSATNGDLVFAAVVEGVALTTLSASSGFTMRNTISCTGAAGPQCYGMEDQIVSSTTNYSPQFAAPANNTTSHCYTIAVPPFSAPTSSVTHRAIIQ